MVVHFQMTSDCTLRCNGVLVCTITDVTAAQVVTHWSLRELKSDLRSSLSQVCMCGYEGCNTRIPMRTMYRMDLRCTDDTWPRPPVGMETEDGGSRRLPRNVRNDEMGYEIWVCEDLVIVFPTETYHRTAVVSERVQEKQRVVMSTQTGGARDPSVFEGILVRICP